MSAQQLILTFFKRNGKKSAKGANNPRIDTSDGQRKRQRTDENDCNDGNTSASSSASPPGSSPNSSNDTPLPPPAPTTTPASTSSALQLTENVLPYTEFVEKLKECIRISRGHYFCEAFDKQEKELQDRLTEVILGALTEQVYAKVLAFIAKSAVPFDGKTEKSRGCYIFLKDEKGGRGKVGMAFRQDIVDRVAPQRFKKGTISGRLCTVDEAVGLIDEVCPTLVANIKGVNMPGLRCHPDQDDCHKPLVCIQLVEGILTASYKQVADGPILERLYQMPCKLVRTILQPPSEYDEEALKLFQALNIIIMTWMTLLSAVRSRAKANSDVAALLGEPPEGKFATLHLHNVSLGEESIKGSDDSIAECPAWQKCEKIGPQIEALLEALPQNCDAEASDDTKHDLRALLEQLQGYQPYDPPDSKTLGNAGIKKFAEKQQEKDIEVGIVAEQCLYAAMQSVDANWSSENLNENFVRHLGCGIDLREFKNGRRLLLSPSEFIAVAENVPIKHRLRALASHARKLHYSVKSGSITPDQFNQQIGLTKYYAMMLYGPWNKEDEVEEKDIAGFLNFDVREEAECLFATAEASIDEAATAEASIDEAALADLEDTEYASSTIVCNPQVSRRDIFPERYFRGAPKGVFVVSKNIKIHHGMVLALQCLIGTVKLERTLKIAYGFRNPTLPLNQKYQCPICNKEWSEIECFIYWKRQNFFLCHPCYVNGSTKAKDRLHLESIVAKGGTLKPEDQHALDKYRNDLEKQRNWAQANPKSQEANRRDGRNFRARANEDPVKRTQLAAKAAAQLSARIANGNGPESHCKQTYTKVQNLFYPHRLISRMSGAIYLLALHFNKKTVDVNIVHELLRMVEQRYASQYQDEQVILLNDEGNQVYILPEYHDVIERYMAKDADLQGRLYHIPDRIREIRTNAGRWEWTDADDFLARIVHEVCDNDFEVPEAHRYEGPSREEKYASQEANKERLLPIAQASRLRQDYDSLREAHDEWFGLGDFEGLPIAGGFEACDRLLGSGWKKAKKKGETTGRTDKEYQRIQHQAKVCRTLRDKLLEAGDDTDKIKEVWNRWNQEFSKYCEGNAATKMKRMQDKKKYGGSAEALEIDKR